MSDTSQGAAERFWLRVQGALEDYEREAGLGVGAPARPLQRLVAAEKLAAAVERYFADLDEQDDFKRNVSAMVNVGGIHRALSAWKDANK